MHIQTILHKALKAGQERDYAKAVELLRPLAEQDVADAQRLLGDMLRGIYHRTQFPSSAATYKARTEICTWQQRAVENYRKAAQQGAAHTQYWLGVMLKHRRGVHAAMPIAGTRWLWKAAKQGSADAKYELAKIYEELAKDQPVRLRLAVELCGIAAKSGNPGAKGMLGRLFAAGKGVPRDCRRAVDLLTGPAKGGDTDAQFWLGVALMEADEPLRNYRRAVYWLRRVAQCWGLSAAARARLAILFHQGHALPRNYLEAYDWYLGSRQEAQPETTDALTAWIVGVFKRATPRNARSFVLLELLGGDWKENPSLESELVRRLVRLAADTGHPAVPDWVLTAIGRALGPLRLLAWDSECQRRGEEWRASMIGQVKGSGPVPEGGFVRGVKEAVVSRIRAILRFASRFDEDYRHKLAGPPHRLGRKAQEALGSAWIAVSSRFVADSDRPYRGEFTLGTLETLLSAEYFKKLPPEFAGITLEQVRKGYLESRLIGGSAEYPYLRMLDYHLLVKSGLSLVQAGDLKPQDLQLITRLGPSAPSAPRS